MARTFIPRRPESRRAPWVTITLVTLMAAWAGLVVVIGATQSQGSGGRVFMFAAVIAVAAAVVAASALDFSAGVRATGLVAAGMAATYTGVLAGFTVGLPLVPVGMIIILMGLTAAEGAAAPRRVFGACAAAALVVAVILGLISLVGREGPELQAGSDLILTGFR